MLVCVSLCESGRDMQVCERNIREIPDSRGEEGLELLGPIVDAWRPGTSSVSGQDWSEIGCENQTYMRSCYR